MKHVCRDMCVSTENGSVYTPLPLPSTSTSTIHDATINNPFNIIFILTYL